MPHEIVLRHRLPQFMHVFSSDGYSAGYYSYLWSDVIMADSFGAFTEAGGPYDKKVADRLRKTSSQSATRLTRLRLSQFPRTRSEGGSVDEEARF